MEYASRRSEIRIFKPTPWNAVDCYVMYFDFLTGLNFILHFTYSLGELKV